MVHETLQAAKALAREGISAEVIDVATLAPLDMDTILTSVRKTGRCVIVHEAARNGGYRRRNRRATRWKRAGLSI